MNGKQPDIDRKRLVNFFIPNKVYLLVTHGKSYVNMAPVTWVSPYSYDPPAVTIALKKGSDSVRNIRKFKDFCICIPDKNHVQDMHYCSKNVKYGSSEVFMTRFTIGRAFYVKSSKIRDLPWMECRSRKVLRMSGYDHYLVVADVVHIGGIKLGIKDLILEYGQKTKYRTTFGRILKVKGY